MILYVTYDIVIYVIQLFYGILYPFYKIYLEFWNFKNIDLNLTLRSNFLVTGYSRIEKQAEPYLEVSIGHTQEANILQVN